MRLVLDDFGTGYSSLQHLRDLPVDMVKIDRSFVANMEPGRPEAAIVGAVVFMCAALGMDVVAEGVEHEEQADLLRGMGCPLAQGFHFGRPEPAFSASESRLDRHGAAGAGHVRAAVAWRSRARGRPAALRRCGLEP